MGGGTAGCVLAARLSEDPDAQVLLLEAGTAEGVPDMSNPDRWPRLQGTAVDWADETVAQTELAPADEADKATLRWSHGKVLGGSSSINAMAHMRGDRSSYDAWDAAGAEGWNYESLLPFFKRSERAPGRDPAYRGMDGPMSVALPASTEPLLLRCFSAAVESGYPANEDGNGVSAEGTAWQEMNVVEGRRQSAADAYLTPVEGRVNLTIMTEARVRRLNIDRAGCHGVEFDYRGQLQTALAECEVILSAGAICTPVLLLHSGVGPEGHLRDLGIEVACDLPGVGSNLHDHPRSQVAYATTRSVLPEGFASHPYVLLRTSPSVHPDVQILFREGVVHPRWRPGPENGFSVVVSLMAPASRGTVRLASADPDQPPLIDPGYLTDPGDIARLTQALRIAREIGSAPALADVRDRELYPGPDLQSDAALQTYVRSTLNTYWHAVGTAKMGTDTESVVDPRLRVRGIENLRVADASVMPSIISANPNATVLAIAERAASLIAADHKVGQKPS